VARLPLGDRRRVADCSGGARREFVTRVARGELADFEPSNNAFDNTMAHRFATVPAVFGALLCSQLAMGEPVPSNAADAKAYRKDAARHIYALNKDQIYKGKLPPLVHAIVVTEVDVDANGKVGNINLIRTPSHAPDVTARVQQLIHAASPMPAPQRMGGVKYMDVWLVDKSGRFQLDTLTEGQR
jgi:protein TonB